MLEDNKGLTETRLTVCLSNDKPHPNSDFIEDFTVSEVQLLDDLFKVHEVLNEIKKICPPENLYSAEFNKFDFTKKWHRLSKAEKNRYFSEFVSYELNFFLMQKDKPYFEEVVKPYTASKMEKHFVDYYLLGDLKRVCEYA